MSNNRPVAHTASYLMGPSGTYIEIKLPGNDTNCSISFFYVVLPVHLDTIHVKKTNLMHYLASVYFVNQPLYVSDIFAAHHQEVYCICTTICTCCAFYLTVCWPAGPRAQSRGKAKFFLVFIGPCIIVTVEE